MGFGGSAHLLELELSFLSTRLRRLATSALVAGDREHRRVAAEKSTGLDFWHTTWRLNIRGRANRT